MEHPLWWFVGTPILGYFRNPPIPVTSTCSMFPYNLWWFVFHSAKAWSSNSEMPGAVEGNLEAGPGWFRGSSWQNMVCTFSWRGTIWWWFITNHVTGLTRRIAWICSPTWWCCCFPTAESPKNTPTNRRGLDGDVEALQKVFSLVFWCSSHRYLWIQRQVDSRQQRRVHRCVAGGTVGGCLVRFWREGAEGSHPILPALAGCSQPFIRRGHPGRIWWHSAMLSGLHVDMLSAVFGYVWGLPFSGSKSLRSSMIP